MELGMPFFDLLLVLGLGGVEALLVLSDGAVKAVPNSGTMGVDDGADIVPLDNTKMLVLLVQLVPLVDKRRHLALAPGLAAPHPQPADLLMYMADKWYGGWCCGLWSGVVVKAALIKLLVE
jgi:hypothetical protein